MIEKTIGRQRTRLGRDLEAAFCELAAFLHGENEEVDHYEAEIRRTSSRTSEGEPPEND